MNDLRPAAPPASRTITTHPSCPLSLSVEPAHRGSAVASFSHVPSVLAHRLILPISNLANNFSGRSIRHA